MSRLLVSEDGMAIKWQSEVTTEEWTARAPSLSDWQRLWRGNQTADSLAHGVFRWVNGCDAKEVVVVFSPLGGLDFNLTYSVATGELLKIAEAR